MGSIPCGFNTMGTIRPTFNNDLSNMLIAFFFNFFIYYIYLSTFISVYLSIYSTIYQSIFEVRNLDFSIVLKKVTSRKFEGEKILLQIYLSIPNLYINLLSLSFYIYQSIYRFEIWILQMMPVKFWRMFRVI